MNASTEELQQAFNHLTKRFDELVHLSKVYPLVITFGRERHVLEGQGDIEYLLKNVQAALEERQVAENSVSDNKSDQNVQSDK